MNVTAPNSATQTQAPAATDSVAKAQVDYQSFLRLLVAQMKNQDPTNPMDSTQYVAQLAAFSQVEQSIQMNTKLEQMLQSSALAQADSLIGRTVTSADGEVSGTVASVRLLSDGLVAVLADGTQMVVEPGVSIS